MILKGSLLGVIIALIVLVFVVLQYRKTRQQSSQKPVNILRTLSALTLLAIALNPAMVSKETTTIYNNKYDVYFVIDLTASMVAEDWDGTKPRLVGVKEDINDLMDFYVGAKYSLITFHSTASMLRAPLTPNSTAIATAINSMHPELTIHAQGSKPDEPLSILLQTITSNQSTYDTDRATIVFYFGDGETTSPDTAPLASFEPLKELADVRIYGYGTLAGGAMKTQTGIYISADSDEYIRDKQGNIGLSVIDETNLKEIARTAGGDYHYRTADTPVEPLQIERELTLSESEATIDTVTELYHYFYILLAALITAEATILLHRGTTYRKDVKEGGKDNV